MNDKELSVEEEVKRVVDAVVKGSYCPVTKRESMTVRLAALSEFVHEMQVLVQNDRELQGEAG